MMTNRTTHTFSGLPGTCGYGYIDNSADEGRRAHPASENVDGRDK